MIISDKIIDINQIIINNDFIRDGIIDSGWIMTSVESVKRMSIAKSASKFAYTCGHDGQNPRSNNGCNPMRPERPSVIY